MKTINNMKKVLLTVLLMPFFALPAVATASEGLQSG